MNEQQPQVQWSEDEVFSQDGVTVRVNCLPLRKPQFSVSVTFEVGGRNPSRFLPVRSDVKLGKVVLQEVSTVLHSLMQQAEFHIWEKTQAAVDEQTVARIERERSQLERGPKPVKGLSGGAGSGKTARRREAKRAKTAA
jgi:hypothetical protein